MQIHPEIGPGGAPARPRTAAIYEQLAEAAHEAELELNWSRRLPFSRFALAAAERVRIHQPESHRAFTAAIFPCLLRARQGHQDWAVIAGCAEDFGIDPLVVKDETTSGEAENDLRHAERRARWADVTATPSSLVADQLIVRLRPRAFLIALGDGLTAADHRNRSSNDGTARP